MSDEKKPLHVEAIASATSRVENRGSMISLQLLLAVNAALMFLVLLGGYTAYQDLTMKYNEVQHIIRQPELVGSYVEVVMQEAVSSFIFGAVNGSLANFAYNMFRAETLASTASEVSKLATSVVDAFGNSSSPSVCPTLQCTQGNIQVQCLNGNIVYCEYAGQIVSCNGQTCVGNHVVAVASLIGSVASNIAELSGAAQSSNSQAAFNTGLLNIQGLISWIERQTVPSEWSKAGSRCLELADSVKKVSWHGSYVDDKGNSRFYDENKRVANVVGYFEQVCTQVASMSSE